MIIIGLALQFFGFLLIGPTPLLPFMQLRTWLVVIALLFFFIGLFVVVVNTLQARKPSVLPQVLQSWDFLPECMRSLAPMDRVLCAPLSKMCCACCGKKRELRPRRSNWTRQRTFPAERHPSGRTFRANFTWLSL